jgi:hypothetical protein
MKHIQEVTLKKALAMLDAVGCEYHIAIDGQEFGEPISQKPKRGAKYGYGVLTEHIKKYAKDLQIGQSVSIPFENFDMDGLQSVTSSYVCRVFGNGSCITSRNKDDQSIDVIRVS